MQNRNILPLFFRTIIAFMMVCGTITANAQKILVVSNTGKFYEVDIGAGCTYTEIQNVCSGATPAFSIAQFKNTVYYSLGGIGALYSFDINNPGSCRALNVNAPGNTLTVDKNGTLYWAEAARLFRLPVGAIQPEFLGYMPYQPAGDLVFFGNRLLMAALNGELVEVDINTPSNSKLLLTSSYSFFGLINVSGGCDPNKIFGIAQSTTGSGSDFVEIDIEKKQVLGKVCNINISVYDAASITESGEAKGANISAINISPQCDNSNNGSVKIIATTSSPSINLNYTCNGQSSNTNGVFNNLSAGAYTIKIVSSDGCEKDTLVRVPYIERVQVKTLILADTCGAGVGKLEISPQTNHTGLIYSINNGTYTAGAMFSGLAAGSYSLKVKESNGCLLDTAFVMTNYQPPIPLNNVTVVNSNCGESNGSIQLSFINGANIQGIRLNGSAIQQTPIFTNLGAGNYRLQIMTPNCTFDTSILISEIVVSIPQVSFFTKAPDCVEKANGWVQINVAGTEPPYTYSFNKSTYTANTIYQKLLNGMYPVQIMDRKGCVFSDTVIVPSPVYQPVTIQSSTKPVNCRQTDGGKVLIHVVGSEAPYFYQVNGVNYLAGKEASGFSQGTYKALIKNGNNCIIDSTSFTITYSNTPGIVCDTVFVPSAFTPNADGLNDVLRAVTGTQANHFIFRVYNRTGQLIFETREPQKGWDGRLNGIAQPSGVYVWTCSYTSLAGQNQHFQGTTVLIR